MARRKQDQGIVLLLGCFLTAGIIGLIAEAIISLSKPIGILLLIVGCLFAFYQIYAYLYFNGNEFKNIKQSIEIHTKNCNELNTHIEELKRTYSNIKSYNYGKGILQDNSVYKYSRHEWRKKVQNDRIHYCSSSVCKNASDQPFKYLCKYFDIQANEETLTNLEIVLNNFAAAEQGQILLKNERDSILNRISISIPSLIWFFSKERLTKKLGFEPIDLSDLYFPIYTFQYVSAGGNSSFKCDIKLNTLNIEKFIEYLSNLVKFKNSVTGQRQLMTSALRERIKRRDNYACQKCGLSVNDEKNLLLEIDHIIPLSKGGVSSESNLQTLCWKCNRSKGSKIY